ncbi:hypothetical protein Moror_5211 [Moniliophthora roreri MCA 2997]|uniref:Uncharacterized protein n=1 Tax=Moniliophthora roreri (strain MCA 2997) TaxID=1381753 RepID=V2YC02_MONRO|nr:hypothetical protein Moror_5211 [Moniliophthora roreri MCA 2997]
MTRLTSLSALFISRPVEHCYTELCTDPQKGCGLRLLWTAGFTGKCMFFWVYSAGGRRGKQQQIRQDPCLTKPQENSRFLATKPEDRVASGDHLKFKISYFFVTFVDCSRVADPHGAEKDVEP